MGRQCLSLQVDHWEQHQTGAFLFSCFDKGPVPERGENKASGHLETFSHVNHVIPPLPGYSGSDLLFSRKGGLLVEPLPRLGAPFQLK